MSKEKRPAFMLYASDWLSGTADMEAAERGMYINLLCHQWINGELPSDFKKLCRLAGVESKDSDATSMLQALLQAKFKHTPSNAYVNARLEQVRERKIAQDQKFSDRAKTAAAARWEKRDSEQTELDFKENDEMLQASSKHATSNAKSMLNEHEHKDEHESENRDENRGSGGKSITPQIESFLFAYGGQQIRWKVESAYVETLAHLKGQGWPESNAHKMLTEQAAKYQTNCIKSGRIRKDAQNWLKERYWEKDFDQELKDIESQKTTAKGGLQKNGKSNARNYTDAAIEHANRVEAQFGD